MKWLLFGVLIVAGLIWVHDQFTLPRGTALEVRQKMTENQVVEIRGQPLKKMPRADGLEL